MENQKNQKKQKLAALLGVTELAKKRQAALINDYSIFFTKNQGAFVGKKSSYTPAPGYNDNLSKQYHNRLTTTVAEKMMYMAENIIPIWNDMLTVEKTNSSGIAKANLIIDGKDYGEFTSLELLGMKTLFTSGKVQHMIKSTPTRREGVNWVKDDSGDYADREVYKRDVPYQDVTTEKESYIVDDPNVAKSIAAGVSLNYAPVVKIKETKAVLGGGVVTELTGAISHTDRAQILDRLTLIQRGITEALARANDVEVEDRTDVSSIVGYLFG